MPLPDYVKQAVGEKSSGLPDYVRAEMQPQESPKIAVYDVFGSAFADEPQAAERTQVLPIAAEAAKATGEALGLEKATEPFARSAARTTTKLEGVPEQVVEEALPEPTTAEWVGGGLQIGSMFIPYGKIAGLGIKYGSKILPETLAKIGGAGLAGGVGGYTYEAGEKIQKGEAPIPGMTTAIGTVAPVVINKLLPKSISGEVDRTISQGVFKGIKPSITSTGKTLKQRKQYLEKTGQAINEIISNKNNLSFIDEAGGVVKGRLPRNLNEFSSAIDQTKKNIFSQYDALAKQAGGRRVDLTPIANELEVIAVDDAIKLANPSAVRYAKQQIARLINQRSLTTSTAQDAISSYNNSLKTFYSNPSYDNASKVYIDSLIANKLREQLNKVITESVGGEYQSLKNSYGALKAIEKDVNIRAVRDAEKPIKNLVSNLSDVASGSMAVHGLLGLNPKLIAASATAKGLAKLKQRLSDPNRVIENMFMKIERLNEKGLRQKLRKTRFPGDIIIDSIGGKK